MVVMGDGGDPVMGSSDGYGVVVVMMMVSQSHVMAECDEAADTNDNVASNSDGSTYLHFLLLQFFHHLLFEFLDFQLLEIDQSDYNTHVDGHQSPITDHTMQSGDE